MHGTGRDRGVGEHTPRRERAAGDGRPAQRTHGRASQRIVEKLRLLIRRGDIASGNRLPAERELCEQYGVSRVTVREALRVLEANGLVDIRLGSHGGAFVTAPTAERAAGSVEDYLVLSAVTTQEAREVRTILELGLVPLACERASEEDLERLGHAYGELERARQEGQGDSRAIADFHVQLARAAGNAAADMLLRPLYAAWENSADHNGHEYRAAAERGAATEREGATEPGCGAPETGPPDIGDYQGLLDAVRERDAPRATAILRAHIERRAPR